MKNYSIKTTEKGTSNIKQLINVSGMPENIIELAALAANQSEAIQDRVYKLFIAGFEAKAKATFPDGVTDIDFTTVITRSGRRTQAGLIAAIGDLIVAASTRNPSVIPKLVALMTAASASFKGRTDEYYDTFDTYKREVDACSKTAEE